MSLLLLCMNVKIGPSIYGTKDAENMALREIFKGNI
jgi:hypothetical protein